MKALVYTGPESLEIREVADPVPAARDVLVEIEAVGICGSDMHAYLGPAPLILGHEAAGTVVDGPQAGRRVTINPLVTCGVCPACVEGRANLCPTRQIISMPPREGAFASHVAIPERNVVTVPDGVSWSAAALAEPIACGWHAVGLAERALTPPLAASRCLVLGGGAIGMGAALVLAARGAREIWIADTNAERRAKVARAGDFRVFDPLAGGGPEGGSCDLVVDAAGFEATRAAASAAVRPGGAILHIGLGSAAGGLDVRRMTLQEITFIGTYTYTPTDFRDTAAAIFEGRLGALDWIEERALEDGPAAFAAIRDGRVAAPKTILKP
jgi:L-iditol 2-dehydrogenase